MAACTSIVTPCSGGGALLSQYPTLLGRATSVHQRSLPCPARTYSAVQWGYRLQCAAGTLDYPCTVSVLGTAIVASTVASTATTGCKYVNCNVPYLSMVGFIGTRTFYGRYGQVLTQNISLAADNEEFADQLLYLGTPFVDSDGVTFYLNGTDGALTEFQGGLFGNEVNFAMYPNATETVAISNGNANTLYYDISSAVICSTAPGFVAQATPGSPAGSASMASCQGSKYTGVSPSVNITASGLRSYNLQYSVGDGSTYLSTVSATLYTDGSVNYDSLGNVYYKLIAASGTRAYTYIPTGAVSVQSITSLMAQNIVATSNLAYITNNNRLYPTYPYFDRYGAAFTLNSSIAPDGTAVTASTATSDIIAVLVYRDNTLEEYSIFGGGNYPPTNTLNQQLPLTLTPITAPSNYKLVQWCYVMYGLANTLDYPWSVVTSGTALIDTTAVLSTTSTNGYSIGSINYYPMLGFVGTRTFTNRYGTKYVNALTLNQLGEDHASNQLWLQSPYAGGISFHLNATIQTQGGLPATDMEVFLDPYPIEGTAYGYGVGAGSNALNNDPSRTIFATNAPNFVTSVYSNLGLNAINGTSVGSVYGTNDMTQCVASFPTIAKSAPSTGVRVYQFNYQLFGSSNNFSTVANLTLVTDGTVNVDGLGNYYFNVAAISGTRTYTWFPTNSVNVYTVSALLPFCSGPSVSNIDSVYCNNNRLYPQYPYIDRLGLAFQHSTAAPRSWCRSRCQHVAVRRRVRVPRGRDRGGQPGQRRLSQLVRQSEPVHLAHSAERYTGQLLRVPVGLRHAVCRGLARLPVRGQCHCQRDRCTVLDHRVRQYRPGRQLHVLPVRCGRLPAHRPHRYAHVREPLRSAVRVQHITGCQR